MYHNQGKVNLSEFNQSENQESFPQRVTNRVEVLKVLSQTILRELSSFEVEEKRNDSDKINLPKEVRNFETDLICCALIKAGGSQRKAAQLLGIKFTTLNSKIKKYGINPNGLVFN